MNTLPLAGFIFGYACRRTVALFDRFVGRVMGAASDSIDAGPKRISAMRTAFHKRYEASQKPRSLPEFRDQALAMAEDYVKTAVHVREEKSV